MRTRDQIRAEIDNWHKLTLPNTEGTAVRDRDWSVSRRWDVEEKRYVIDHDRENRIRDMGEVARDVILQHRMALDDLLKMYNAIEGLLGSIAARHPEFMDSAAYTRFDMALLAAGLDTKTLAIDGGKEKAVHGDIYSEAV